MDDDLDPVLRSALDSAYAQRVGVDTAARHLWVIHRAACQPQPSATPPRRRSRRARRTVVSVLTSLMMITSSGVAVAASATALPGELLYPVKRTAESARLMLSLTPAAEARQHLALAARRYDEARRLSAPDPATAGTLVVQALDNLQAAERSHDDGVAAQARALRDEVERNGPRLVAAEPPAGRASAGPSAAVSSVPDSAAGPTDAESGPRASGDARPDHGREAGQDPEPAPVPVPSSAGEDLTHRPAEGEPVLPPPASAGDEAAPLPGSPAVAREPAAPTGAHPGAGQAGAGAGPGADREARSDTGSRTGSPGVGAGPVGEGRADPQPAPPGERPPSSSAPSQRSPSAPPDHDGDAHRGGGSAVSGGGGQPGVPGIPRAPAKPGPGVTDPGQPSEVSKRPTAPVAGSHHAGPPGAPTGTGTDTGAADKPSRPVRGLQGDDRGAQPSRPPTPEHGTRPNPTPPSSQHVPEGATPEG